MKINSQLLRQYLYNVLLWTPGKGEAKKSPSEGFVAVFLRDTKISFLSTDAYTVVQTGAKLWGKIDFFATGSDLKVLESELRGVEGDVPISILQEGLHVDPPVGPVICAAQYPQDPKFWATIQKILHETHASDFPEGTFALAPRRLSKFSLLEPRDKYPVDFTTGETSAGQQIFLWKYGPESRGALAPLDRAVLWETYGPDVINEVLW